MIYNKSLHPDDYAPLHDLITLFDGLADLVPGNVDHPHQRWEYSLALSAVLQHSCQTILEIGSGGSLFALMAALCGLQVTCVDPAERVTWAAAQSRILGKSIDWVAEDFMTFDATRRFDAVVCLSTIEHVVDDGSFFDKALWQARQLVVFTMDFSMDGGRYSPDHLRTYSPSDLMKLAQRANGWRLTDTPAWKDQGKPIFGKYNFASLCLCTT